MAYMIYPKQEICNIFNKSSQEVDTLDITDGFITVGQYMLPIHQILYIKEV